MVEGTDSVGEAMDEMALVATIANLDLVEVKGEMDLVVTLEGMVLEEIAKVLWTAGEVVLGV